MTRSLHGTLLPCTLLIVGLSAWGCAPDAPGTGATGGTTGQTGGRGSGGATSPVGSGGAAVGAGTGGTTGPVGTGGANASGGAGTSTGGSSTGGAASGGAAAGGTGSGGRAAVDGGVGGSGNGGTTSVDPGTEGDGDFMVGPTYTKSSDLTAKGAPAGRSFRFTMNSTSSTLYKGLDTTLLATNQHSFTRNVDVYVPAKYKDGTAAPFLIIHDGPGALGNVKLALDNLTQDSTPAARRLPAFIAIAVANGGGDSKGSERGLEYDTMSDRFVRFIETEVVPAVLSNAAIKAAYPNLTLTKDPDGRATIGCSSGGAAALTMGWFRPDLFRRLITYSGTFVDQQDDDAPEEQMYPLGAWDYHSGLSLIANTPAKPLRIFINANQNDNGATAAESGHHNWVLANQRTAAALKAKNYHYRYVFGQNAGHCAGQVQDATLADTLIWAWRGYVPTPAP